MQMCKGTKVQTRLKTDRQTHRPTSGLLELRLQLKNYDSVRKLPYLDLQTLVIDFFNVSNLLLDQEKSSSGKKFEWPKNVELFPSIFFLVHMETVVLQRW